VDAAEHTEEATRLDVEQVSVEDVVSLELTNIVS
tara:strand:+ start:2040 stop:2141 length:102 start_codon:yes stop_codon:yes gene_type:complete